MSITSSSKKLKDFVEWAVKNKYAEASDLDNILSKMKEIRNGLYSARNGYYLWVKVKWDKCMKCKHWFRDCGKFSYKKMEKWIPCSSDEKKSASSIISPGMIPPKKKPYWYGDDDEELDYPPEEAMKDALNYCWIVAQDPENAPRVNDPKFGRADLIIMERIKRKRDAVTNK